MVQTLEQAHALAAQAAEQGANLVEYRIDQFTQFPEQITQLVEQSPLACIVTCRPTWEGGLFDDDESLRISLLEHAGMGTRKPAYVDIELVAYQRSANLRQKVHLIVDHPAQARDVDTGLILSSHDFEQRPSDLERRFAAMIDAPNCRVAKLAWKARSLRDNLQAFELLQHRLKPTIALCMGTYGLPSRVLAKKFNALLTFASLDNEKSTAPGQPTVHELKHLYRWDHIQPDTRVYGVIGHPIGHSMSPPIHNAGFDQTGYNGVYLPMPIPPEYEHFKATVGAWLEMKALDFMGASVTIPHKENLMRFVREAGGEIEPLSQTIGAANTLVRREDGTLYACNTDYAAILDSVCHSLNIERRALRGKRIAVIGAGGAARAAVAGFASEGATVVVYNRTLERAQQMAEQLTQSLAEHATEVGKIVATPFDKLCQSCCDIIVNCTSIGMSPHTDASPLDNALSILSPDQVVFDTIYNPMQTKLMQQAEQVGAKTISGVEMFVRQAAVQFELWTQQPAPVETFRQIMQSKLASSER